MNEVRCIWFRVLNMPGLHKVLNMSDCTWVCMIMPKWILFHFSPLLSLVYINAWLLIQHLHETRKYSLKGLKVVFLKTQNLIFSYSNFKISNLLLPLGGRARSHESWYTTDNISLIKDCRGISRMGFFSLGFTPCKADQPLRGMELTRKRSTKLLKHT